jgi:hypothetical protein
MAPEASFRALAAVTLAEPVRHPRTGRDRMAEIMTAFRMSEAAAAIRAR